jgi:hypothetical protein
MNYILGAINTTTNRYENIISVEKTNKYNCLCCSSDLILRKGEKRFQSFVHKTKNGCTYFKNPSQDQLIYDAQLHLKTLIEDNRIDIYRHCNVSLCRIKINIPDEIRVVLYGETVVIDTGNDSDHLIFKINPDATVNEDDDRYQINMLNLIQTCIQNFATKKIEIVLKNPFCCDNCKARYF